MEENLKELIQFYEKKFERNKRTLSISKYDLTENRYLESIISDLKCILEGKKAPTWEIK